MTFEQYLKKIYPDFDPSEDVELVEWLRKFWHDAQKSMLSSVVEGLRASNPCPLVILSKEEAKEYV